MTRPQPWRAALTASATAVLLVLAGCAAEEDDGPAPRDPEPAPTTRTPVPPEGAEEQPEVQPDQSAPRVRATFFGMHEGRVAQGVTPPVPVGALRFWDSGTSWLHLETSPGQFTWAGLDTAVAAAEDAGARPLLVLGQTPVFHASRPAEPAAYGPGAASMPDLAAWKRYVGAVAARYGDRIDYQIWNETNISGYWAGSPRQMAELTLTASTAIRQRVPGATVVAPPFALRLKGQRRYFEDFWSLQSPRTDLAEAVDAVAVHLYPAAEDAPEAQLPLLEEARGVLAEAGVELPVWNTEINYGLLGGPEPPPIPQDRQRAYLFRTYLLNAGESVARVYWYRWDISRITNTYLTQEDLSTVTPAGASFERLRTWLEGASVSPCESRGPVWSCAAEHRGEEVEFVWRARPGTSRVEVERGTTWERVDGESGSCEGRSCALTVGEAPVRVVSRG